MIGRPFLVALYALAQARRCISAVSNRTIDDVVGDEVSGALPIYTPSPNNWNAVVHNNCTVCAVKPDPTQAFNQTWHDVSVPAGTTYSVILNFTGTAIYFFGIVPNAAPTGAIRLVNLTFTLDGTFAGAYTHFPDNSGQILYSVPMLSKDGLSNNPHTLVAQAQSSSLLLFDYAMYTFETGSGITGSVLAITTSVAPTSAVTGDDGSFPVITASQTLPAPTSAGSGVEGLLPSTTTLNTFAMSTSAGSGDNSSLLATSTSQTLTGSTSTGAGSESPLPPKTIPDTFATSTSAGAGSNSSLLATSASHTLSLSASTETGGKSLMLPATTLNTLAMPTSASAGGNSSFPATTSHTVTASTSAGTGDESPLLPTATPDTLAAPTSAGARGNSSFPATSTSHTLPVSTSTSTGESPFLPTTTTSDSLAVLMSAGAGGSRENPFPPKTSPDSLTRSTSAGTGGASSFLATTTSLTLSAFISGTTSKSTGTGGKSPVPATNTPDTLAVPASAGTGGGSPVSHNGAITGYTVAGILSLVGIAGLIALANWVSQVIQAKKASKPGMFPSKKEKIKSHQITLTLTPVDIEEGYTYRQVVWQRFNIDNGSSQFTARLDYDRAFGTANIRRGRDEINSVSFCDRPLSIGHAKPGRIIPLKGSAWANPLEFIIRKYNRITARNDSHAPVRMVLGSYICQGSEGSSTESFVGMEEGNMEEAAEHDYLVHSQSTQDVGFQSFVVMDHETGYAETLSASFDLILRAYKTHGVEVGQILSPLYLRDEAVPLLGEQGIRISKLPKIATWGIIPNKSGIELKRERMARTSRKHQAAV
ncbi:hypothetical protein MVEN_01282500 [Mycena venus]|uniref:Uncharacterized protein n=1 Tax=Mycena venus TaxID=2733690 RepID=A0A8H6Y0Y2_9AGAR|nr:hypothetical protein MVEN_01282500 [Mycena venus]